MQLGQVAYLAGDKPRKNGQVETFILVALQCDQILETNQVLAGALLIDAQKGDALRIDEPNVVDAACACRRRRERWLETGGETLEERHKMTIDLATCLGRLFLASVCRTKLRCLSFALLVALFHLNPAQRSIQSRGIEVKESLMPT